MGGWFVVYLRLVSISKPDMLLVVSFLTRSSACFYSWYNLSFNILTVILLFIVQHYLPTTSIKLGLRVSSALQKCGHQLFSFKGTIYNVYITMIILLQAHSSNPPNPLKGLTLPNIPSKRGNAVSRSIFLAGLWLGCNYCNF